MALDSSPFKNLAMGDCHGPSVIFIHASPFAPNSAAYAASSSIIFLEKSLAAPLTLIPLTTPPFSTVSLNTLNSQPETISEIFLSSSSNLVSGLSLPNLSIASAYSMRGIGSTISIASISLKSLFTIPSNISITSSSFTNDISRSTCVNSGCRSARRSSSLKQRTIW